MNDILKTVAGVLLPFIGTAAGASAVFLLKKEPSAQLRKALYGFAAGVMMAASVWSLLIPAIRLSGGLGRLAFLPAAVGFLVGAAMLSGFDFLIVRIGKLQEKQSREGGAHGKTVMLILAVTLHNLPEGMAVGVVFAGLLSHSAPIGFAGAMTLSLGIALQNLPEGAIVSMPLSAGGKSKGESFLRGVMSGVVEPIGAVVTLILSSIISPLMPYFLAFAAGAMIYVVVKELIPESQDGESGESATIGALAGFMLMMILDVALG